jgi:sugar fermentation stimulation protein A
LEVKNVTLSRTKNLAEFPDAVTSRGLKHLNELCVARKKNFKSYILYLIQREGCDSFKIANDIDKEYKTAFNKAKKCGVRILCYNCKLSDEEIIINTQVNYEK